MDKHLVALLPFNDVSALFDKQMGAGGAFSLVAAPAPAAGPSKGTQRQAREHPYQTPRERGPQQGQGQRRAVPKPLPVCDGVQLIGDSLMLRLGQRIIKRKPFFNQNLKARQLGACISGITASQLLRYLRSTECPPMTRDVVAILIGTNNVLKKVRMDDTLRAMEALIKFLQILFNKTIVLTLPPLPKHESMGQSVKDINQAIRGLAPSDKLQILDVEEIFHNNDLVIQDMFESDGIHWSPRAMDLVREKLKSLL